MQDVDSAALSLLSMPKRGVYAITPPDLQGNALLHAVALCLQGGPAMLQYRAKHIDAAQKLADAIAIAKLCKAAHVPLIINDDLALAGQLQVGVHLGEFDVSVSASRSALGNGALIGASCYDSVVLAQRAADAGASYVAFGSFFPSSTKDQPRRASIRHIEKAKQIDLPVVAIGGIDLTNAAPLIAAGADFVAVVSAIFSAPDITKATANLSALFD